MLDDLRYRLRALFRRAAVDRELDDELRFHLEQHAAMEERAGADPSEARRRARLALGGLDATKEASRDARGLEALDIVARDLRYAIRTLRRTPGLHRRRRGLAGPRHRRQHRDVPAAERAGAATAARGTAARVGRNPAAGRRSRQGARRHLSLPVDDQRLVGGAARAPAGLRRLRLGRRGLQPRPGRRGAQRLRPLRERRALPGSRAHPGGGPAVRAG